MPSPPDWSNLRPASRSNPTGPDRNGIPNASVAQLVEQLTLNQLVLGSSPSRGTSSQSVSCDSKKPNGKTGRAPSVPVFSGMPLPRPPSAKECAASGRIAFWKCQALIKVARCCLFAAGLASPSPPESPWPCARQCLPLLRLRGGWLSWRQLANLPTLWMVCLVVPPVVSRQSDGAAPACVKPALPPTRKPWRGVAGGGFPMAQDINPWAQHADAGRGSMVASSNESAGSCARMSRPVTTSSPALACLGLFPPDRRRSIGRNERPSRAFHPGQDP